MLDLCAFVAFRLGSGGPSSNKAFCGWVLRAVSSFTGPAWRHLGGPEDQIVDMKRVQATPSFRASLAAPRLETRLFAGIGQRLAKKVRVSAVRLAASRCALLRRGNRRCALGATLRVVLLLRPAALPRL